MSGRVKLEFAEEGLRICQRCWSGDHYVQALCTTGLALIADVRSLEAELAAARLEIKRLEAELDAAMQRIGDLI